jgi:hypothetical protein
MATAGQVRAVTGTMTKRNRATLYIITHMDIRDVS